MTLLQIPVRLSGVATTVIVAAILLALSTLSTSRVEAATRRWSSARDIIFRTVAADAALPGSNTPLSIAQDREGFIWIASETGVSRWDGYTFKTYSPDSRSGSLPERSARIIATDGVGRLWVGLMSEGLLRFDAATETFRRPANATPLDRERIYAITKGRNGALWVASDSGVVRVDGRALTVDYSIGRRLGLPIGAASSVVEDKQGRLHVVLAGRLYRQDAIGRRLRLVSLGGLDASLPTPVATALFVDHANRVWVSTASPGAILIDPSGNLEWHVQFRSGGSRSPQPRSMAAIEVGRGLLWFGTHDGIYEVDSGTLAVRRLHHDANREGSLPDNSVNPLMIDRSGLIWVGAATTLAIANPRPTPVFSIQTALGYGTGHRAYRAWVTGMAPDGRLWLGAEDDPVRILEQNTSGVPKRIPGEQLRPRGVTSFAFLPNGEVYAASELGLFRMSADGRVLKRVTKTSARRLILVGPILYIGGSDGLVRLDTRTPNARPMKALDPARLTFPRVTALMASHSDVLWIGTVRGLNRFDLTSGHVTRFEPNGNDPHALSANYINSLLIDRFGRIWVATGNGIDILERIRSGKVQFRHLRSKDGLPNEMVDSLLSAPDGAIWASTDGGIVRIDPRTLAMKTLREAEGLQSLIHWAGNAAITDGGELIFAAAHGLTGIDPTVARAPSAQGRLVVTDLKIGAQNRSYGTGGRRHGIEVLPVDGSFAVEFSALDFAAADRVRYSYRMRNFETGWTLADPAHRTARYTNLPPGDYVLQARANGRDGSSNGSALDIPVHIVAAWYQTMAFKGAVALFVFAACWGVTHLRLRLILRRERLLEAVIKQRTAALHASQSELKKLAYFDALTGLANRRMFTQNLQSLLTPTERQAPAFALILVDLDKFKTINDTLGHDVGDALLVEVAGRLVSSVRENDSVARLGGDEFAILVSGQIDASSLKILCARVIDAVGRPIVFVGKTVDTSASLGVALFPDNGQTQDELYKAADLALYEAKRSGRNTWRKFSGLLSQNDVVLEQRA